jgi:hypothetical protein
MAVSIPIWLSWIMAAIVLNESFHPACVGKYMKSTNLVTVICRGGTKCNMSCR